MADLSTRGIPSQEKPAEGRREALPRGGIPLIRKDGGKTRRAIIDKSLQIFSVKGYYNTSIRDIMTATGLTKGGLYAHFDGKEALWNAAYERAVEIWRGIVFKGVRKVSDPLDRIAKTIENDLRDYCCGEVFEGGCFFSNSLVELSGQSSAMSGRIVEGVMRFADLLASWLEEAKSEGKLKPGMRNKEVADFIVTSINGAAALYAATRDSRFPRAIERQLGAYIRTLRAWERAHERRRGPLARTRKRYRPVAYQLSGRFPVRREAIT